MNIKIVVAVHKPYQIPNSDIYFPIHVGAEGKRSLGFVGDNSENNISLKNPFYCELTGLYWAWKNINYDICGLVHYRRYFGKKGKVDIFDGILNEEQIIKILSNYDIILGMKKNYYIESIREHFKNHIKTYSKNDYYKLIIYAIKNVCPEYLNTFYLCTNKKCGHMCNMFITTKKNMDLYCSWLFPLLFWMEENHNLYVSGDVIPRIYGFIGELLLDTWVCKNGLKIKEEKIFFTEKEHVLEKSVKMLGRKFLRNKFR